MRFGLAVPTLLNYEACSIETLRAVAAIGDEHDFECLWVGDHLLWHLPILETTVTVSMLSVMTSRAHVGTNVLLLPLRRPIDVAKSFATLSHLTDGRIILGVGVGGEYKPEWAAAGIDPTERGRRCDEAIDALRWYWEGVEATGRYYSSPGVSVEPRPKGHLPIWVGGRSQAAVRRAARCDGYLGVWISVDRYKRIRDDIDQARGGDGASRFGLQLFTRIDEDPDAARDVALSAMQRTYAIDPTPFAKYVAAGPPHVVAEFISAYGEAGVDHMSIYLVGPDWHNQVRRLTAEVLPAVRQSDRGAGK